MGFHTFTILKRLTYSEAIQLYRDFQEYRQKTDEIRVRPLEKSAARNYQTYPDAYIIEYIDGGRGITWQIRFCDKISQFCAMSLNYRSANYLQEPRAYSIRAVINPKVFTGIRDYLSAANEACIEELEDCFNAEASLISAVLGEFEEYSLTRVDYCVNFDLGELGFPCSAKQLIALIKRSDVPKHFKVWTEYDKKSHRRKSNKAALYLSNKSVTINCYWKYAHLKKEYPDCEDLEASREVVRFEVQCKYAKVYPMARVIRDMMRHDLSWEKLMDGSFFEEINPTQEMLSNWFSARIIRSYFQKIVGKGDYLTLDAARWMVERCGFQHRKQERLIWTLELVNECRGIAAAKSKVKTVDADEFKRSLKELNAMLINPVTIPRDWGIEHITNPLRAYYNYVTEEQLVGTDERRFWRYFGEYLG